MAIVMNTLAAERTQSAWTGREGAAIVGMSGHQVSTIPGDTEVTIYDEVGSYTRVAFGGRTGLVLTENLYPEPRWLEVASVPQQTSPSRESAKAKLLRLLVSAGALGGVVSAVLLLR